MVNSKSPTCRHTRIKYYLFLSIACQNLKHSKKLRYIEHLHHVIYMLCSSSEDATVNPRCITNDLHKCLTSRKESIGVFIPKKNL